MTTEAWFAVLAIVVSALTGAIEVLSRYRDEPFKVISTSGYCLAYITLHGLLGLAAFAVLRGQVKDPATGASLLESALTAGFGAALVIRSRVFTAKVHGQEVSIGPAFVVDQLLLVLDRQIDRQRAIERTKKVKEKLEGLDFNNIEAYVSTMILGSRQNLSLQDQEDLANQLKAIKEQPTGPQEKSFALGFLILDFMGEKFLTEVLQDIQDMNLQSVKGGAPSPAPPPAQAVEKTKAVKQALEGRNWAEFKQALGTRQGTDKPPLDASQWKHVQARIADLDASAAKDEDKLFALGFDIMDLGGPDLLKAAAG